MIEKILRKRTHNLFTNCWYKETTKEILKVNSKKTNSETVKILTKIEKANNQHDGEWLPISEIIKRTRLQISNQKLGIILTKNDFKWKFLRFQGKNSVKCYYVRLL